MESMTSKIILNWVEFLILSNQFNGVFNSNIINSMEIPNSSTKIGVSNFQNKIIIKLIWEKFPTLNL